MLCRCEGYCPYQFCVAGLSLMTAASYDGMGRRSVMIYQRCMSFRTYMYKGRQWVPWCLQTPIYNISHGGAAVWSALLTRFTEQIPPHLLEAVGLHLPLVYPRSLLSRKAIQDAWLHLTAGVVFGNRPGGAFLDLVR